MDEKKPKKGRGLPEGADSSAQTSLSISMSLDYKQAGLDKNLKTLIKNENISSRISDPIHDETMNIELQTQAGANPNSPYLNPEQRKIQRKRYQGKNHQRSQQWQSKKAGAPLILISSNNIFFLVVLALVFAVIYFTIKSDAPIMTKETAKEIAPQETYELENIPVLEEVVPEKIPAQEVIQSEKTSVERLKAIIPSEIPEPKSVSKEARITPPANEIKQAPIRKKVKKIIQVIVPKKKKSRQSRKPRVKAAKVVLKKKKKVTAKPKKKRKKLRVLPVEVE